MYADGILFDLDGTLWDSVEGILLTWNRVITRHGGFRPPISRQEQESLMGLQMDEIARRLFSQEPPARQQSLMEECMQEENEYLAVHGGVLYPALEETLGQLQKRHKLCIVSNCQRGYIEAFLQAHHMEQYFVDFLSYGDTGKSKGENNRQIIARNGFRAPVYVGDTQGDRQSALDAGIPFVYAAYGFGQVTEWDARIETFAQLGELFGA